MTKRTLDWRPHFDPQSVPHRLAVLDCYAMGKSRANIQRTKSVYLDQGSEGACTGFGLEHVRAISPKRREVSDSTARTLYREAQRHDEWEGEQYEGSSVNGAMKAARHLGLIKSWRWAYTLQEIDHGLSYHGAFEIGVWWWSGMFVPDKNGVIHVTGSKEGGHALALSGYKVLAGVKMYRLDNSWGPEWGDKGGCWISEFNLQQLLNDDGEFAIPCKV